MDYTVNDAINILFRCGITTVPTLMKHLARGKFEVSERSVQKKVSELKAGDILQDGRKSNSGPTIWTEEKLKKLKKVQEGSPLALAPELAEKSKLKCHPRTISRGLAKLGLKYSKICTIPVLTERHIAQRLEFANSHGRDRMWERTFFLDESTFQAYSGQKACYQYPDQRVTKPHPKHPPKVNAIAMISSRGATRLVLFEGIMNASMFIELLEPLLQDARKLYPDGKFRIYWDNDPKHNSKLVKEYIETNELQIPQDWPSCSPDLNPIENAWGLMGTQLQKFMPKTLGDLKNRLRVIWKQSIHKDHCKKLLDSMPHRIEEVKLHKGLKINY